MIHYGKFVRMGSAVAATALFVLCGVVHAQSDPAAPPPPPPGRHGGFGPGPMSDDAMRFVGFEAGLGGKTVAGAPFSATFSTHTTQALADGNQIQHSATGTFARDSEGRTRRDMTLPAVGPWATSATSGQTPPHVVFISDNVAKTQYILEPNRKIARQTRYFRGGKRGGNESPDAKGAPPEESGNRRNVVTASLGTQTINGVQAEGTRTTHTIPAGAIGNANPIVITNERWYSAELQTVVMIKRSDPRMGVTTFELTNIQKLEPDAALFQVPADYAVKNGGPGGQARFRNRGGAPPPAPGDAQPQPPSTSQD